MFDNIIKFLESAMSRPTNYGWFHLVWLILISILSVIFIKFFGKSSPKKVKKIVFIFGVIIFILEIYKLVVYSYDPNSQIWSFQWYAFPFQFCSTPIYVCLLCRFIKNEKVLHALYNYLGIYCLFAGICVMLYPNDVFIDLIGVNIQTMFLHGGMVVIGVFIIKWKTGFNIRDWFSGSIVFLIFVFIALGLNIIAHYIAIEGTFNMFFISPYFNTTLVILNVIYPVVPYLIFLLIYIIGFLLAGLLVFGISYFIKQRFTKKLVTKW